MKRVPSVTILVNFKLFNLFFFYYSIVPGTFFFLFFFVFVLCTLYQVLSHVIVTVIESSRFLAHVAGPERSGEISVFPHKVRHPTRTELSTRHVTSNSTDVPTHTVQSSNLLWMRLQ